MQPTGGEPVQWRIVLKEQSRGSIVIAAGGIVKGALVAVTAVGALVCEDLQAVV